ncbi:hypothetical protein BYT27DRAFT_7293704 [Phlegmacium glaucopus]|nr:hypothetical protein BYT27DRAFT_7293704 [Phlegmacium glaucopus]
MNFLDTYDISRSATPNPSQNEQPSLNEEVNQVISQLGHFWGGFRKQSQTALETARKDFSEVVVQAQKELSKFTTVEDLKEPETTEETDPTTSATGPSLDAPTTEEPSTSASSPADKETPTASTSTTTLFSRLQSALPPNIVTTVHNHLPDSLKSASESLDFSQLGTNLMSEFQRVQGVTRAQAEEYVLKSEVLIRDAMKEASEVLRDAVKVIPPDQVGSSESGSGVIWDGTDMWMLPADSSDHTGRETGTSRNVETQTAVSTRAEALLRRLKRDPAILRHDPEADEGIRDEYHAWLETEVNAKEGGIDGQEWTSNIAAVLEEPLDGPALKELRDKLAPSELTLPGFWLRFFFRTHQIRKEEEKRKALIQSTTDNDEDFSWEDDDEEPSGTPDGKPVIVKARSSIASLDTKTIKGRISPPTSQLNTQVSPSPRVSSEDSFDFVSSSNVSVDEMPRKVKDEDDSDWE